MPVSTISSHVNRAKAFYDRDDVYFAIGKSTPWGDPDVPPDPTSNTTDLLEIIGYKKVELKFLVTPDEDNGTLSYMGRNWAIVQSNDIYTRGAKWLYLETTILPEDLPLGRYRQIGIYTGLIKAAGVSPAKYALLPTEVMDNGTLEILDNRGDTNRLPDTKDTLKVMIEF